MASHNTTFEDFLMVKMPFIFVWQVPGVQVIRAEATIAILPPLLCPAPEWLDPGDNGGAVKRFQLGLHYSLIYCDRPPRPAVMSMLPTYFWASSIRYWSLVNAKYRKINCKKRLGLKW